MALEKCDKRGRECVEVKAVARQQVFVVFLPVWNFVVFAVAAWLLFSQSLTMLFVFLVHFLGPEIAPEKLLLCSRIILSIFW